MQHWTDPIWTSHNGLWHVKQGLFSGCAKGQNHAGVSPEQQKESMEKEDMGVMISFSSFEFAICLLTAINVQTVIIYFEVYSNSKLDVCKDTQQDINYY